MAIGLGVEERVLDLQRISWRSEVVKGGWDMDGLHKMNLQQIDSPDSKDSHHPGQYLGYVSADHENLSCCIIQAQGRSPSCTTLYKGKQGVQTLKAR